MSWKTHLQSFSHNILGWPIFWDPKLKKFVRQEPSLDGFGGYKCTYRLRTIENGIQMHHGSEALRWPFCLHTAHYVAFPVSPMWYADLHPPEWLMNHLITSTGHMLRAFSAASSIFGNFEHVLVGLTIPILSPPPILQIEFSIKSVNAIGLISTLAMNTPFQWD